MWTALLFGFAAGFIGAMPIAGPISVLVFRRALGGEFARAIFIAVGGAVAEGAYALLAFWGFSVYLAKIAYVIPISRAVAAIILLGLGIGFLVSKPASLDKEAGDPAAGGKSKSFLLGLSVALLNPTLIATWTALVTTLFSLQLLSFAAFEAFPFAAGVTTGIVTWFFVLVALVRRGRQYLSARSLLRLSRAMGVFVLGVGVWFVQRFFASL